MDFQTAFNVAMSLAALGGPFVVRSLFDRIKDAKDAGVAAGVRAERAEAALAEYKTHVADNYLGIRRFEGFEERLFAELKAIKDRLDDKQDRA